MSIARFEVELRGSAHQGPKESFLDVRGTERLAYSQLN